MTDKMINIYGRKLIKGSRLSALSIMLFGLLTTVIFALIPSGIISLFKSFSLKTALDGISTLIYPITVSAVFILISFLFFMILSSVSIGEKAWYSGKMSKKQNSGKRLRFWFKPSRSFKALRLEVLLFGARLLWDIVFLSPALLFFASIWGTAFYGGIEITLLISLAAGGILLLTAGLIFRFIVVQRYFLAPYLMAGNPKLKPLQAVKQSKNLLEGHIFRIVKFKLKHLPRFLLYPLILPAIFFFPSYKQSCCVIAKEICL